MGNPYHTYSWRRFMRYERFAELAARANTLWYSGKHHDALVHATRLWNLADHMEDGSEEVLWAIMLVRTPWAFATYGCVNSMRFTYR